MLAWARWLPMAHCCVPCCMSPRSSPAEGCSAREGWATGPRQPSQLKTKPGSGLCTLPLRYSEQNLIRSVSSWFNAVDVCILKLQSQPNNKMNFHCFSLLMCINVLLMLFFFSTLHSVELTILILFLTCLPFLWLFPVPICFL